MAITAVISNSTAAVAPAAGNQFTTSGAFVLYGDNFASGFISALLQGKDIRDCGIYANCTAAISVQYVGATTGVRNKEMVEEMLEKYKKDYIL